jgi:hypothetical protein
MRKEPPTSQMRNGSATRSVRDTLRSICGVTRNVKETASMEYGTDSLKLNTKRAGYVAVAIWICIPEVPDSNTFPG